LGGANVYTYTFNDPLGLSIASKATGWVTKQLAKIITKATGKEILPENVSEEIFGRGEPQSCQSLGPNACDQDGDGIYDWLDKDRDDDGVPDWRDPDPRRGGSGGIRHSVPTPTRIRNAR
jgi:hypothetical protein